MLFLNWSNDEDPGFPSRSDANGSHWNLWKVRQHPYALLTQGSRVVLVDSWPGGGRMSWEVEALHVVKEPYNSKAEASRLIAAGLGLDAQRVRRHYYTVRGPDSGYVLAFRYRPVRKIDLPRPAGMRFRPNGWLLVEDSSVLSRWGLTGKPAAPPRQRRGGQGRLSLAERLAVEDRAMQAAKAWCLKNGWPLVEHVSRKKSWDLEGRKTRNSAPYFVEVKGTIGPEPTVELTAAEVRHALRNPGRTILIVVTGINLNRNDPAPAASGGRVRAWRSWAPDPSELEVTRYRWKPSGARGRRTAPS